VITAVLALAALGPGACGPDPAAFRTDPARVGANAVSDGTRVAARVLSSKALTLAFPEALPPGWAECLTAPETCRLESRDGSVIAVRGAGEDRQLVGFRGQDRPVLEHRLHFLLESPLREGVRYRIDSADCPGPEVAWDTNRPDGTIQVNQAGYATSGPKLATVGGWLGTAGPLPVEARLFEVRSDSGDVAFRGELHLRAASDPWSGNQVFEADFTGLHVPGSYRVVVRGIGSSPVFRIAPDVYEPVYRTVMRLFYHVRNGTPVRRPWADPGYERAGGVPAALDGVFDSTVGSGPLGRGERGGDRHPVSRGWFDAGDYGQYVVNAAVVWYAVSLGLDLAPANLRDGDLGIPESGNGLPDVIDELEWGMDWALSMQDDDGGVYSRIASRRWDASLPARIDTPRLVGAKTTHATAAFAAMAAIHARLIQPWRPERARKVLAAAEAAWRFATTRPAWPAEGERYRNPPGIFAGEYADTSSRDGLLWAAAELFRTTGRSDYLRHLEEGFGSVPLDPTGVVSFHDQGMAAAWAIVATARPGLSPGLVKAARQAVVAGADWRIARALDHPFRAALHPGMQFVGWGNFAHSTRATLSFLQAWKLTGEARYLQWAWLSPGPQLGVNPQGLSYITGIGTRSPRHPLSKLSQYDENVEPLAGIPVNGPHFRLPMYWSSTRAAMEALLPGGDAYPALRRYSDSELIPPMSEPTIAEVAVTAIAFAMLRDERSAFSPDSEPQP